MFRILIHDNTKPWYANEHIDSILDTLFSVSVMPQSHNDSAYIQKKI